MRGRGFFFLPKKLGLIFIVFALLLSAVLSLSYMQQAYQKKEMITLPGVYVRTSTYGM